MNVKFHIPDFCLHGQLNFNLLEYMKKKPQYFREGVEIGSVYGCFPPAKWNGGRIVIGDISEDNIKATIQAFNSRNVPLRYTFTNPCITSEYLADEFCNHITSLAHNGFNEIIIYSPVLEAYIRKTYPKYPLVSSTVKQLESLEAVNAELEKNYKLVVLDYNLNNNFEKLAKIQHKERCEVLINPYCARNCKRRGAHYKFLGRLQLTDCSAKNIDATLRELRKFDCPLNADFYEAQKLGNFVTVDDVFTKYVDMGFTNFKIEGRNMHPLNVQESYVYYMVKPEFRNVVRLEMMLPPEYVQRA
jgi:collagenase-like PrtC family protease